MAVSGQPQSAAWIGTRFFAVDNDSGSDLNLGYSDATMAESGLVPLKTLEHLKTILPRVGGGQRFVITCKSRAGGATYKKADGVTDDNLVLDNLVGYQGIWVRGTADVPSAGAVAFSDSANDRIACGGQIVPGTNAAGYNATGVPTVSTFDCQLNGGGAPGLAAEPAYEHKRVRFDVATVTAALRNATRAIWANDTDTITVDTDLPAAPVPGAGGDIFYIEEAGFAVKQVISQALGAENILFTIYGHQVTLVGVRGTDVASAFGAKFGGSSAQVAFCDFANTGINAVVYSGYGSFIAVDFWLAHDDTFAIVGAGFRSVGSMLMERGDMAYIQSSGITGVGRRFTTNAFAAIPVINYGAACYSGGGSFRNFVQANIGNLSTASQRFWRTEGPGSGGTVIALPIGGSLGSIVLDGIQTLNAGPSALYRLGQAYNVGVRFKNCIGSAGNTGTALDMTSGLATDCSIVFDSGNTFSGGPVQFDGAGDIRHVHADYLITDWYDVGNNHFQGNFSGVSFSGSLVGRGTALTSDGTTTLLQYGVGKVGTLTGTFRMAQADTLVKASGVFGVMQDVGGGSFNMLVNSGSTWVQFEAAPTLGAIAYLSRTIAGNATTTVPPASVTEVKLRLGNVEKVSGTLGLINWNPDTIPVLADGLA